MGTLNCNKYFRKRDDVMRDLIRSTFMRPFSYFTMQHQQIKVNEIVKGAFSSEKIDFNNISKLGEGSYGGVVLIECPHFLLNSSRQLAIKVVTSWLDEHKYDEVEWFREMQRSIDHAFINKAYGYTDLGDGSYVLYLEYIEGGTMDEYIDGNPRDRTLKYFLCFCLAELSEGLDMMHKIGIVHLDLHMSNILIRANGHLVICDFGFASRLTCPYTLTPKTLKAGDLGHYAPELRTQTQDFINHTADYYSLGVMAYEICTGLSPPDPLSPDYRKLKGNMFESIPCEFKVMLCGLLDPSKDTRLCSGGDGNIPLLSTDIMKLMIWSRFGIRVDVNMVKQKICELQLPSPFVDYLH